MTMALTKAQLEIRRGGIGSSEIAAVVGLNPDEGPLSVWLRKVDPEADDGGSEQTEIGDALEEPIARMGAKKIGSALLLKGETVVRGLAVATPDYYAMVAAERGPTPFAHRHVMECKSVGYRVMHRWDPDVSDDTGPPEHVVVQVQWQLEVLDLQVGHVSALLGGRDHRVFHVERDRTVGAWLVREAEAFWRRHVETREPPPMDGSDAGWAVIARRHPRPRLPPVEAVGALAEELGAVQALRASQALLEAEVEVRKQRIAALIGDAEAAVWDDAGRRRWVRFGQQRGRVGWKAVALEAGATPEMIERHRGAGGRVLALPPHAKEKDR